MSVYTGADIIQENAICTQTHYCLLSELQAEQCQKGTEARWFALLLLLSIDVNFHKAPSRYGQSLFCSAKH